MCEDTADLQRELSKAGTSEEFVRIIATYIRGRGELQFSAIPDLPVEWQQLAGEQDAIGWDNFMEGKLSSEFQIIVRTQMLTMERYMTASDWVKKLISRLLQITHGQWLYRNAVVHERMSDGLTRVEQDDILMRIEEQCMMKMVK